MDPIKKRRSTRLSGATKREKEEQLTITSTPLHSVRQEKETKKKKVTNSTKSIDTSSDISQNNVAEKITSSDKAEMVPVKKRINSRTTNTPSNSNTWPFQKQFASKMERKNIYKEYGIKPDIQEAKLRTMPVPQDILLRGFKPIEANTGYLKTSHMAAVFIGSKEIQDTYKWVVHGKDGHNWVPNAPAWLVKTDSLVCFDMDYKMPGAKSKAEELKKRKRNESETDSLANSGETDTEADDSNLKNSLKKQKKWSVIKSIFEFRLRTFE
eukprot:m.61987 g.61987  ORF g.61987 m.61987 type:complete len:268 (+) comp11472_c0_seq1:340-1143(+)